MNTLEKLKNLELAIYDAGIDGGMATSEAIEDLRAEEKRLGLDNPMALCPRWLNPSPEDAEAVMWTEQSITPTGQLLARMGWKYLDTESSARMVAEHAAGEIQTLKDALRDLLEVVGDVEKDDATIAAVSRATTLLK